MSSNLINLYYYIIFTYNFQVSVRMSAGIACRTASVYSETDLHNLGGMHLSHAFLLKLLEHPVLKTSFHNLPYTYRFISLSIFLEFFIECRFCYFLSVYGIFYNLFCSCTLFKICKSLISSNFSTI